jgi:exodeoxyribonuclease X
MERSMITRILDLETTGLTADAEVVEVAYYDVTDGKFDAASMRQTFIRPARLIPAVSSGIHHITNFDVRDAPSWNDAWRLLLAGIDALPDSPKIIFAAHMASFERQWIDPLVQRPWICSWKCSLRQWPEFESHSLQAIRYELALPVDLSLAMPPHRAAPDAYVCAMLLLELLKHQTVETLIAWSAEPAVFTKFDFGEHIGKPLSAARSGYFEWMLTKDFSADWQWNARRELQRRASTVTLQAAADRQAYLTAALEGLPSAACVRDLENWFFGQSDQFAQHGILPATDEYDRLIAACAARKAELLAAGQPSFERGAVTA